MATATDSRLLHNKKALFPQGFFQSESLTAD